MYKENKYRLIILLFWSLNISFVFSQSAQKELSKVSSDTVKYQLGFKFNDGLFLSFQQVKENKPIPFQYIVSHSPINDRSIKDYLDSRKEINVFYDGQVAKMSLKNIWGYASNGVLYIQMEEEFYRIPNIGRIALFVAEIKVEYVDYGNSFSSNYYAPMERTYTSRELKKFFLDFSSGSMLEYSSDNLNFLLSGDEDLHREFSELSNREQRQYAYQFIRKFNKKYPLYFRR